ncbi:MAG: 5-formyltetrahydrofolate cyclo-ligase [Mangrovicoccus sp.]|nr:5-formyltetrahydrofolate cyclo-ligase [Mangrovicoccus sp.]
MTGPDDLARRKAAARAAARDRRQAARAGVDPAPAVAALLAGLAPYRGRVLAGYMPIRSEIDPLPVMTGWAAHSPVCLPVVVAPDQPLVFRRWHPGAALTVGAFGVRVPADSREVVPYLVPELVIVPLLAFDGAGRRLGYGGGFYDRTLQALRAAGRVLAIGFAYAAQHDPALPHDANDQRLDAVATEAGLRWFRAP